MKGSLRAVYRRCHYFGKSFVRGRHATDNYAAEYRQNSAGFTIVETLVVLVVTGALFASAVILISGRQGTTEFAQAAREIQSELQQTINEVSSGYYTSDGKITCVIQGSSFRLYDTAAPRGTNEACIFMGKVVRFGIPNTGYEGYDVYTMVGLRTANFTSGVNLSAAKPRVVAFATGDAPGNFPLNQFDAKRLRGNMTVVDMTYGPAPGTQIRSIGFVSSLASFGMSDASQQVNLVAIPNTATALPDAAAVRVINDELLLTTEAAAQTRVNPTGGVRICFKSGTTKQSALMTIGGGERLSTVALDIKNSENCT